MRNFWEDRFSGKEFAYGREPNAFFKKQLDGLPVGKILLPAEGEGRNAIYAASKGWEVVAFDASITAKRKAELLAKKHKVSIDYRKQDFDDFKAELGSFDCIALIYAHMPHFDRQKIHRKLTHYLKPGGALILEGFSKDQLGKSSGGPDSEFMLFSEDELSEDFNDISELDLNKVETELKEGKFRKGQASVIRIIGKK